MSYPFKAPRRVLQIAGATALAAVSGWLALDYLGAARVTGVADAVALPVEVSPALPATFNTVVAGATSTLQPGTPPKRSSKARVRHAPANPVIAEVSPAVDVGVGVKPVEPAAGPQVGAMQPMMILPPPVAMLAAACALQQKLVDAAQVH